jgi:hypothetical protein
MAEVIQCPGCGEIVKVECEGRARRGACELAVMITWDGPIDRAYIGTVTVTSEEPVSGFLGHVDGQTVAEVFYSDGATYHRSRGAQFIAHECRGGGETHDREPRRPSPPARDLSSDAPLA